jgi:hypothetical protein
MATIIRGKRSRPGRIAWQPGTPVGPESAPPPPARARARRRACRPYTDAQLFDWLERTAASIEHDDVARHWTVYPAVDGMTPARGPTLRAAAFASLAIAAAAVPDHQLSR